MTLGILSDIYRVDGEGKRISDYGITLYDGNYTAQIQEGHLSHNKHFAALLQRPLEEGELVRVFKTVTDGTVLWEGTVSLEYDREQHTEGNHTQQAVFGLWVRGLQRDLSSQFWAAMFHDHLPAKLEKPDGRVMFGSLEPFSETGTEGVVWSLSEYGKAGYEALKVINDDNRLTVYSSVCDGEIDWEGGVSFGGEGEILHLKHKVVRLPLHMDLEKWQKMVWGNQPVMVL